MSDQANKYKSLNKHLKFDRMSLADLQKLPAHNGIINFRITETSFTILNILNDDSSAVKYFWKGSHDIESLDLWYKITRSKGLYIDVGAHTGLYTITAIKANTENQVISFEPYFMNMSRLITNLRLNGIYKNILTVLGAASDFNGKAKFKINTERSYLSKGGRIDNDGIDVDVYKLDNYIFDKYSSEIHGIKIDTEGEDFKVLLGAKKIIDKYRPEIIIEVRESNKIDISNLLKKYSYSFFDVLDLNKEIDLKGKTITNIMNVYARSKE